MTGGPDNSTPAPAPARPAGRRFRLRLAAVSRWLHIYTSMLGLAAVLFFSITGLTLNHPDWMFGSVRRQNDYRGRLPAEWLAKSGQGSDQLRIVEFLRREHRLHGAVEEFREDDSGGSISFKGPGYSADVFFDPAVGKYDVSEVSEGLVAVLNDRNSRGGSRHVHEQLRVGQTIAIGAPRNHFRLDETAPKSVLLAGGIGITPVVAMLRRLSELQKPAHLIYCARSRHEAAFVAEIDALVSASPSLLSVQYHFDDEAGAPPDLPRLLDGHGADTHFYCCGPGPMLDAYERACEQLGQAHVHLERFAATAAPVAPSVPAAGYSVELRKSGITVQVAPGVALLDALLDAGLNPEYSCREGVCGACETRVISGDVDHRDHLLSKQERAASKSMMICVSGCRSGSLVLDA